MNLIDEGDFIWNFILKLPINQDLKNQMLNADDFLKLPFEIDSLNENNLYKIFYMIIIFQKLSVEYVYWWYARPIVDAKHKSHW